MDPVATAPELGLREAEIWLESVRGELRRVASAIEPLLLEQARLRDRESLLVKLLHSFNTSAASTEAVAGTDASAAPSSRPEGSVLEYVRACVLEVLRENGGRPMHINDIHAKFVSKGFRVPGAGRPANLTAHLGRCPGIASPSRGFYAIGESVERPPRRRGRRRR